uniref:Uncharacterized protein n=1 Tax=Setaria italica TaxID=4555 RepID=K3XPF1_SETIT
MYTHYSRPLDAPRDFNEMPVRYTMLWNSLRLRLLGQHARTAEANAALGTGASARATTPGRLAMVTAVLLARSAVHPQVPGRGRKRSNSLGLTACSSGGRCGRDFGRAVAGAGNDPRVQRSVRSWPPKQLAGAGGQGRKATSKRSSALERCHSATATNSPRFLLLNCLPLFFDQKLVSFVYLLTASCASPLRLVHKLAIRN